MALQTPTPSSSEHPPSSTTQPQEPAMPGTTDVNTANSIPFSFLIAFLALFVAFMIIGLWARRISIFMRRRLGLPIPEPPARRTTPKQLRPMIWDVAVCPSGGRNGKDEGGDVGRWGGIQPLSSWYRREAAPLEGSHDQSPAAPGAEQAPLASVPSVAFSRVPGRGGRGVTLAPLPAPSPRRHPPREGTSSLRHLRSSMMSSLSSYWRPTPPPSVPRQPKMNCGKVEGLQVAVFVAMPSTRQNWRDSSASVADVAGELAVGIANVDWDMDESTLDED